MKKPIKYKITPKDTSESILQEEIIQDFLPPPGKLVFKEENERITLNLSKSSVTFFKKEATELGIPYQRMIKRVLDIYARKYKQV